MEVRGEMGVPAAEVGGDCSMVTVSKGGKESNSGRITCVGPQVPWRLGKSVVRLEGVLVPVGHEVDERGSKGAGEFMEVTETLSNSGVGGSKYGFVVLMKVTAQGVMRK